MNLHSDPVQRHIRNEELDTPPLDMTLKIQMAYMLSNKKRGTILGTYTCDLLL